MAFDPAHVKSMLDEASHLAHQPATLQNKARIDVEDYAMSSCLELCTQMQERLPRELRNLVYGNLLEDDIRRPVLCSDEELCGVLASHPHVRDISYMGYNTLVELAETWYQHGCFAFDRDTDVLCLFESADFVWNLPHLDVIEHLRDLWIDIEPDWDPPSHIVFYKFGPSVPVRFGRLSELQKPATLTIKLMSPYWRWTTYDALETPIIFNQRHYRATLWEVLPVLRALIGAGVTVAITDECNRMTEHVSLEQLSSDTAWFALLEKVIS